MDLLAASIPMIIIYVYYCYDKRDYYKNRLKKRIVEFKDGTFEVQYKHYTFRKWYPLYFDWQKAYWRTGEVYNDGYRNDHVRKIRGTLKGCRDALSLTKNLMEEKRNKTTIVDIIEHESEYLDNYRVVGDLIEELKTASAPRELEIVEILKQSGN